MEKFLDWLRNKYNSLGIDPANPNPDGSDYHLMNYIESEWDLALKYQEQQLTGLWMWDEDLKVISIAAADLCDTGYSMVGEHYFGDSS